MIAKPLFCPVESGLLVQASLFPNASSRLAFHFSQLIGLCGECRLEWCRSFSKVIFSSSEPSFERYNFHLHHCPLMSHLPFFSFLTLSLLTMCPQFYIMFLSCHYPEVVNAITNIMAISLCPPSSSSFRKDTFKNDAWGLHLLLIQWSNSYISQ